jgi:predicted homoserine dehydrogenase-like protein
MEVIDDNPVNDVLFSATPMPTVGYESGLQALTQEQEVVLTAAHADLRQRQWLEEHAKDWAV